jgi:hypothetical protein
MTETEKYENCRKERNLIKDFVFYCMKKNMAIVDLKTGRSADLTPLLDKYFNIDSEKLEKEMKV